MDTADVVDVKLSKNAKGNARHEDALPYHSDDDILASLYALPETLVGKLTVSAGLLGSGKIITRLSSLWPHDAMEGRAITDGNDARKSMSESSCL